MGLQLAGLHHITAITSDSETAVRFYTGLLGLRLVKKTVNFDDPTAYHLYFGDENGKPGTVLTFFDWGPGLGHGSLGVGVAQHLAFSTKDEDSLGGWKAWLEQNATRVLGPFDRGSFKSLYFRDPDGLLLEIGTPGNGKGYDDSSHPESELSAWNPGPGAVRSRAPALRIPPGLRLSGLHHVTAISRKFAPARDFYADLLGLEVLGEPSGDRGSQHVLGLDGGAPGTIIRFIDAPESRPGSVGVGTVHHVAFAVEDQTKQLEWRERLLSRGVRVTEVLDRKYFKSIYFREPNGLLLEIATVPPGFTVDEPKDRLGTTLTLPDWLEPQRQVIEASLKPLGVLA